MNIERPWLVETPYMRDEFERDVGERGELGNRRRRKNIRKGRRCPKPRRFPVIRRSRMPFRL